MAMIGPTARHRTAMVRSSLSRPLTLALTDGIIEHGSTVFDYGCGRGGDIRHLEALGFTIAGWDPAYRPTAPKSAADVVNLGYVVNVIEDPVERAQVLRSAWELTQKVLVVSARLIWESKDLIGRRVGDGVVTRKGTFQKFYDQNELASWIELVLALKPSAAAPGVFYVFRDQADQQDYISQRVYHHRPRIAIDPRTEYDQHREELEPLLDFLIRHARPPKSCELSDEAETAAISISGSLSRAVNLIYRVTDNSLWEKVRTQRQSELTVYAAMSRFEKKPRFSDFSPILQRDIKAHFGTYRELKTKGDRLLAAAGNPMMVMVSARSSKAGKQTPSALYIHRSAISEIPPIMQVYEGCAQILTGSVPEANLIKLSVAKPQISYLSYPEFDKSAHPVLSSAVVVNLRTLAVQKLDYSQSDNPPILHRKEEFLGIDAPNRAKYERLTRSEQKVGLYDDPSVIGTLRGWQDVLQRHKISVRGHRVYRRVE